MSTDNERALNNLMEKIDLKLTALHGEVTAGFNLTNLDIKYLREKVETNINRSTLQFANQEVKNLELYDRSAFSYFFQKNWMWALPIMLSIFVGASLLTFAEFHSKMPSSQITTQVDKTAILPEKPTLKREK